MSYKEIVNHVVDIAPDESSLKITTATDVAKTPDGGKISRTDSQTVQDPSVMAESILGYASTVWGKLEKEKQGNKALTSRDIQAAIVFGEAVLTRIEGGISTLESALAASSEPQSIQSVRIRQEISSGGVDGGLSNYLRARIAEGKEALKLMEVLEAAEPQPSDAIASNITERPTAKSEKKGGNKRHRVMAAAAAALAGGATLLALLEPQTAVSAQGQVSFVNNDEALQFLSNIPSLLTELRSKVDALRAKQNTGDPAGPASPGSGRESHLVVPADPSSKDKSAEPKSLTGEGLENIPATKTYYLEFTDPSEIQNALQQFSNFNINLSQKSLNDPALANVEFDSATAVADYNGATHLFEIKLPFIWNSKTGKAFSLPAEYFLAGIPKNLNSKLNANYIIRKEKDSQGNVTKLRIYPDLTTIADNAVQDLKAGSLFTISEGVQVTEGQPINIIDLNNNLDGSTVSEVIVTSGMIKQAKDALGSSFSAVFGNIAVGDVVTGYIDNSTKALNRIAYRKADGTIGLYDLTQNATATQQKAVGMDGQEQMLEVTPVATTGSITVDAVNFNADIVSTGPVITTETDLSKTPYADFANEQVARDVKASLVGSSHIRVGNKEIPIISAKNSGDVITVTHENDGVSYTGISGVIVGVVDVRTAENFTVKSSDGKYSFQVPKLEIIDMAMVSKINGKDCVLVFSVTNGGTGLQADSSQTNFVDMATLLKNIPQGQKVHIVLPYYNGKPQDLTDRSLEATKGNIPDSAKGFEATLSLSTDSQWALLKSIGETKKLPEQDKSSSTLDIGLAVNVAPV